MGESRFTLLTAKVDTETMKVGTAIEGIPSIKI